MIKVSESWSAKCDKCNKKFEVMGREYSASFYVSIEADLKLYGWKVKNKKCICGDCKNVKTN